MSDWQKGDMALCIRGGNIIGDLLDYYPISGRIYTVEAVAMVKFIPGESLGLWLKDGPPNKSGQSRWCVSRFRKIRPSAIKHIEAFKDVPLPVRENEHA